MYETYLLDVPRELDALIRQAMRDEGIEPTPANVRRWMIGALTFTAAACTTPGYQAICDAYGVTRKSGDAVDSLDQLTTGRRKSPPSDS